MTYLDTHAALWLCTGEVEFSNRTLTEINTAELRISPMALMEIQFLQEIGKINAGPREFLTILRRDFEVEVCQLNFAAIVEVSYLESWTRDPFDRMIVAHARIAGGKLISRDRKILDKFADAIW